MMTALAPRDALAFLLGQWSFERVVPGVAEVNGTATVERRPDGAAWYRESAQVSLGGDRILHASQRYLYRQNEFGLTVFLAGAETLFHDLRFVGSECGGLFATATHHCNADVYRSEYALRGDGTFHVKHVVRGPRKEYEVVTAYRRPATQALGSM